MNKASFEQVLGLLKKLLLNVKIHSVHVIRTVWLTVTQLQSLLSESSLSGQRGVPITNFVYSFPVNRIPINRIPVIWTVWIMGNIFCPVNRCPVKGDRVYCSNKCVAVRKTEFYLPVYLSGYEIYLAKFWHLLKILSSSYYLTNK